MKHGFLLINKPAGPTSHDCVSIIRKAFGEKKVGHLGTLDPAATGLMVLAVGKRALKVVELFNGLPKQYIAGIEFGKISTTYDREGIIEEVEAKPGVEVPTDVDFKETVRNNFTGKLDQVPPAHSAIHIDGKRAYDLARKGEVVEMPVRPVEITACQILKYEWPHCELLVDCSSGTYVRSLAHDLGQKIRFGGYLTTLERTKVGDWHLNDAVDLKAAVWGNVLPLKEILKNMPRFELNADTFKALGHGQTIGTHEQIAENTFGWFEGLPVALLERAGHGELKARKML